jgi:hypothetical protein
MRAANINVSTRKLIFFAAAFPEGRTVPSILGNMPFSDYSQADTSPEKM